jgi:hypothetical protein
VNCAWTAEEQAEEGPEDAGPCLQKFCVTATVSVMLRTTWCHPPGTKTISPAR